MSEALFKFPTKPLAEWTREELEKAVTFYEIAVVKVIEADWRAIVAAGDVTTALRTIAPLLIDPSPLTEEAVGTLRKLEGLDA